MFERFTDRARRVVVLAQEEARGLNHGFIGTEHLLLGLIAEGEGIGGKVLADLGADLAAVRRSVVDLVGEGKQDPGPGNIPFTPRAKQALELAFRESLQLGHNYIGTEHVLLGILREGQGVGAQLITRLGTSIHDVRTAVIQRLAGFAVQPGGVTKPPTDLSPALASALELAATRAGSGTTVGTHHVLSVFADWEDVAANQILRAGGFDRTRLERAMEEWDVADTRDETVEAWSQRVTQVEAGDDALTLRVLDADLSKRIAAALAQDDAAVRAAFGRAVRELERGLPPTST